jgi:hypothetical protein
MTKAGDLPIAESYGSRTPARVNGGICDPAATLRVL